MPGLDEKTWTDAVAQESTSLAPPATPEAVSAFEARHGLLLPAAHRDFLLRGNGGGLGRSRLFGVGRPDALDFDGQVAEMRAELEGMADGPVFPFASDYGGSYFCYDLRRPGDYPVLYWDHEYSEEAEDRPMLWSEYAPDFASFVRAVVA